MIYDSNNLARVVYVSGSVFLTDFPDVIEGYSPSSWEGIADWEKEAIQAGVASIQANIYANFPGEEFYTGYTQYLTDNGWKQGAFDLEAKSHPLVGVQYNFLPLEVSALFKLYASITKTLLA
jgi:hypothetical protein